MINEDYITLKVSECKEILKKCWEVLSPQTRESLRSIGINPEEQDG